MTKTMVVTMAVSSTIWAQAGSPMEKKALAHPSALRYRIRLIRGDRPHTTFFGFRPVLDVAWGWFQRESATAEDDLSPRVGKMHGTAHVVD